MKGNDQPVPALPVVLGSPDKPITDPELLQLLKEFKLWSELEGKRYAQVKEAMSEYEFARKTLERLRVDRDARMAQLAEKMAKQP